MFVFLFCVVRGCVVWFPLSGAAGSGSAAGGRADAPVVQPRGGARVPPFARFDTAGGYMQYYPKDRRFTATCTNALHGACILTRYDRVRSRMKGRPCGFMCSWLAASALAETKEDHFSFVDELERDFDTRQDYRKSMACQVGGPEFLRLERDSATGIEVEPAGP